VRIIPEGRHIRPPERRREACTFTPPFVPSTRTKSWRSGRSRIDHLSRKRRSLSPIGRHPVSHHFVRYELSTAVNPFQANRFRPNPCLCTRVRYGERDRTRQRFPGSFVSMAGRAISLQGGGVTTLHRNLHTNSASSPDGKRPVTGRKRPPLPRIAACNTLKTASQPCLNVRRGGRAADCTGLEIRYALPANRSQTP
jgi:hypothetical protein